MSEEELSEDNAAVLDCNYDDEETGSHDSDELDEQAEAVLEGLLYIVGDEGLSLDQAAQALDISRERCEALLDDMMRKADPDYDKKSDIKWNFTKFLVNREGEVIARFEPTEDMAKVRAAVEAAL